MTDRFFAEDHAVEILRGSRKLSPAKIRKALARRAAWLSARLEATARLEGDVSRHPGLDELRSIVQLDAGEVRARKLEAALQRVVDDVTDPAVLEYVLVALAATRRGCGR